MEIEIMRALNTTSVIKREDRGCATIENVLARTSIPKSDKVRLAILKLRNGIITNL